MGFYILEPDTGYLASGLDAIGRLPEPEAIVKRSAEIIKDHQIQGPLTGKKVVVTAGPTREFIDPVRFISNPSSGKMGIAMADAARALGAGVTLLHGPIKESIPDRLQTRQFVSADDLFELMKDHQDVDIVIMAAAVADFKPDTSSDQKIKKQSAGSSPKIDLTGTPDILAWLGKQKRENQILIGFAMETENLIENARTKLTKKNLDWICANQLNSEGSGFEGDTNTIHLLGPDTQKEFTGQKSEIASKILTEIFE
jgi:phosphopantothenoylcysteine decarboxylase/phosphopantothenate--cysteine ligase